MIIKIFINEFIDNPNIIQEEKVNKIKKYYYNWSKPLLKLNNINELKIGAWKKFNKDILFFKSIKKDNYHLILNLNTNEYFFYKKKFKNIKNKANDKEYLLKKNFCKCIIL